MFRRYTKLQASIVAGIIPPVRITILQAIWNHFLHWRFHVAMISWWEMWLVWLFMASVIANTTAREMHEELEY